MKSALISAFAAAAHSNEFTLSVTDTTSATSDLNNRKVVFYGSTLLVSAWPASTASSSPVAPALSRSRTAMLVSHPLFEQQPGQLGYLTIALAITDGFTFSGNELKLAGGSFYACLEEPRPSYGDAPDDEAVYADNCVILGDNCVDMTLNKADVSAESAWTLMDQGCGRRVSWLDSAACLFLQPWNEIVHESATMQCFVYGDYTDGHGHFCPQHPRPSRSILQLPSSPVEYQQNAHPSRFLPRLAHLPVCLQHNGKSHLARPQSSRQQCPPRRLPRVQSACPVHLHRAGGADPYLHVAGVWPTRLPSDDAGARNYDNVAANRARAAAHCFEAKCFGVLCAGVLASNAVDVITDGARDPEAVRNALLTSSRGASMFLDPTGAAHPAFTVDEKGGMVETEFLQDEEGILYADFELERCVEGKQYHNIVGGISGWMSLI
ncbi:uncharacterized protein DSM5745_03873 [Aspergillus mulundensis]|uniref:Uncharacterized protein n=1 Tax=Aspergillus mulundensis TaxID=1810919 RepID=A0A3D8SB07_9EURO|nr:hypothetical protein DSM5745_03873 [Aspergillus mulundensis]RDW83547.1 hypothetical protein DSM5745_03873 [Aspergillus mulundensis]